MMKIKIKMLLIVIFLALVMPASAQLPAPSGNFGYDDFDYPLATYDFWAFSYYPGTPYFTTSAGSLVIGNQVLDTLDGTSQQPRLIHTLTPIVSGSIIRVRFSISLLAGEAGFTICGKLDRFLSVIPGGDTYQGRPRVPLSGNCETWLFTGIGGDNTPNDYDWEFFYRESGVVYMYFHGPSSNLNAHITDGRVPWFEVSCVGACPPPIITVATATAPSYPTPVQQTGTPTYTPIQLTPATGGGRDGTREGSCGIYICGPVQNSLPVLQGLSSPTPLQAGQIGLTNVPLVTMVPGEYAQPTPIVWDDGHGDNLAGYIGGDGVIRPLNPDGSGELSLIDLGAGALSPSDNAIFIAYLKSIYDDDVDYFGPLSPLVQVTLAVVSILFLMMTFQFMLPIGVLFVSLARKAWHALMDLIPF